MKKKEFVKELRSNLFGLPEEDINEIVGDYEEHFKVGKKNKRKESEIAESLGDPREIAKEAKKELRGSVNPFKDGLRKWEVRLRVSLVELFGLFKKIIQENYPKLKKKSKVKGKLWSMIGILFLNSVIFIPLWISFFFSIIALIISGASIVISGIVTILAAILSLAVPFSSSLTDLFLSGLFAGIGLIFFGIIFTNLSRFLLKGFLKLTRSYLKWSKRNFREGKNE